MIDKDVAPPNSLLLLLDPVGGELPESLAGDAIVATASCVAIGCRSEFDGPTSVLIGTTQEVATELPLRFQGKIVCPSRQISLKTVLGENIAVVPVERDETNVLIWSDDPFEPSEIVIGLA